MKITVDKTVVDWMVKNDLWALVEPQMDYYLGNALFSFLRQLKKENLKEAPEALNIRKLIYYTTYKDIATWYILFRCMDYDWYEVIRIISSHERDGRYFY